MRSRKSKWIVTALCIALVSLWAMFVDHIPPGHVGVAYDSLGGIVTTQDRPGWYLTSPFTLVMRVDTKPTPVTVISLANVIVTKLVRFRPEGTTDFLRLQGFGYMFPYRQKLIMVGYAYSGKQYPFLEVMEVPDTDSH